MEVLADGGPPCAPTITGPLAEMVPDPVDEYPMVPVGPALFVVKPPEAETWAPVTFYELPTGERYVHFGVRATPTGGLMDLSLLLADLRELVECESPSSDLAAVARSADVVARIGTARLGVAPEHIVVDGRTHLRWRLGTGPSRVLVLGHHDTVWPLGSLATHPCVRGGRRACAARAAST